MKLFAGICAACVLFTSAAVAQPVVAANGIVNAASSSPVPMPNSGIARGSMFSIYGQNLGPATSPALSWPLKAAEGLGGVVVKIQPVSGPELFAILLFVSPGQINAILPSATPEGQATLTVTYNGATSAPQGFTVVKSSVGLLAWNMRGNGPGVVQNYHGNTPMFNSIAQSAIPGDVAVLWGTGLGPVTFDETKPPVQSNLGGAEVWVAGQRVADVQYAGRSTAGGQDQINFVVPNIEACYVPVFVKVGNVVSNTISMSISRSGQTCSDAFTTTDLAPDVLQRDGLKQGHIALSRVTAKILGLEIKTDSASASFFKYDWARLMQSRGQIGVTTMGACNVVTYRGAEPPTTDPVLPDPLDAGAPITITGPDNASKQMTSMMKGSYSVQLGGGMPGMPGSLPDYFGPGKYTVTGPGGTDVGAFSASITLAAPMVWANADAINEITRSSGVTVNWTGGSGYVTIIGYSGVSVPQEAGATFACVAPASAGTFTVPANVLQALPPSGIQDAVPMGALIVGNYTDPVKFTATGLNAADLSALFTTMKMVSYK